MSKRQHDFSATSATERLLSLLKSACRDPCLLEAFATHHDSASTIAEFNRLLAGATSSGKSVAKRQKKTVFCPSLPAETFLEVVLFLDRDTLDSSMLVCRFMLDCIRMLKTEQCVLRTLSEVVIRFPLRRDSSCTLFVSPKLRDEGAPRMRLYFGSIPAMIRYMRLAYCETVRLDFHGLRGGSEERFRVERDWLFGLLIARETFVDVLELTCLTDETAEFVAQSVQSFKSVTTVALDAGFTGRGRPGNFTEDFFVSLSVQGVRALDVRMPGIDIHVGPALAFGFAVSTCPGRRVLTGVRCANEANFLEQVRQKANELDGGKSVDLELSIMNIFGGIDTADFEKYQKGEQKWLFDDLENRVTLAVEETEETVEIKVRSSL